MKIVVFSDSHGSAENMKKVLERDENIKEVIFCGDGENDIGVIERMFPDKKYHKVRGNCDYMSKLPVMEIIEIEGKKIMYAHGHTYNVKSSYEDIIFSAKSAKVDIVAFGHTHIPYSDYKDGLYVINGGSCSDIYPSYASIDIQNGEILIHIVKL